MTVEDFLALDADRRALIAALTLESMRPSPYWSTKPTSEQTKKARERQQAKERQKL